MLDSNMPMHDRRTGQVATAAQHMGAPGNSTLSHSGGRTAHDYADYWHKNTWMSGPAHKGAYNAVLWDVGGKRTEGEAAFPHNDPEKGRGVLLRHTLGAHTFFPNESVKELHYVDKHDVDPSFPSSMERAEKWRASLPHNATERDVYG